MTTITDLIATVTEDLGLPEHYTDEQIADAVRRHREEPYEAHSEGSEALEALERAVWADLTNGAEYPW